MKVLDGKTNALNRDRPIDWPLISFWIIAYLIAWGILGVLGFIVRHSNVDSGLALLQLAEAYHFDGLELPVPAWSIYLLTRLADFAFSIAGLIMIAWTAGLPGLRQLWQRLTQWKIGRWWLLISLLPILLYSLAVLVTPSALGSADFSFTAIRIALFSLHAGFFVSLFLRGAMGEELGLRGFALPRLLEHHSPFRASLILGVLWGLWHLPVLIGRDTLSIIAFSLLSIGLSMLFTLLFRRSGGSLLPGLLFHATQNWEEGFETVFPALVGSDWELIPTLCLLLVTFIAGFIVWRDKD